MYRLDQVEVQTVLSPKQVEVLRQGSMQARIKFYSDLERTVTVERIVAVPKAIERLPDSSLGSRSGGRIRVDAQDDTGKHILQPMFQFNLLLPISREQRYVGKTVSIRFQHLPVSLYRQLLNYGREVWDARSNY